jgi:hypothetical protein
MSSPRSYATPNETSWTYYKKKAVEAAAAGPK